MNLTKKDCNGKIHVLQNVPELDRLPEESLCKRITHLST